jgi:hypothetical protein
VTGGRTPGARLPRADLSDGLCVPGNSRLPSQNWRVDAPALGRRAAAFACRSCPCYLACLRWYTALPEDMRPVGTVAGQLRGAPDITPEVEAQRAAYRVRYLRRRAAAASAGKENGSPLPS